MNLRALLIGVAVASASLPLMAADDGLIHLSFSGNWSGMSQDGLEVSYSFTKEGAVIWRVNEKEFTRAFPDGLKGRYQVRFGAPYGEIDIYGFNTPWLQEIRLRGIVEITGGESFKMEMVPSDKGDRPGEFTRNVIAYQASRKQAGQQLDEDRKRKLRVGH